MIKSVKNVNYNSWNKDVEAERVYWQHKAKSLSHLTWFFSLIRCLSLSLSLHLLLALPVNPCWDLAHTHWSSLQPKVGQKPSEDRAQREKEGQTEWGREVETSGWGKMTERNWKRTRRRIWFCIICTFKSYLSFHLWLFYFFKLSLRLHNTFKDLYCEQVAIALFLGLRMIFLELTLIFFIFNYDILIHSHI